MSFYSCHSEGAGGDRRISKARFFAPLRCAQNDKVTTKMPMFFSIKFSNFLK